MMTPPQPATHGPTFESLPTEILDKTFTWLFQGEIVLLRVCTPLDNTPCRSVWSANRPKPITSSQKDGSPEDECPCLQPYMPSTLPNILFVSRSCYIQALKAYSNIATLSIYVCRCPERLPPSLPWTQFLHVNLNQDPLSRHGVPEHLCSHITLRLPPETVAPTSTRARLQSIMPSAASLSGITYNASHYSFSPANLESPTPIPAPPQAPSSPLRKISFKYDIVGPLSFKTTHRNIYLAAIWAATLSNEQAPASRRPGLPSEEAEYALKASRKPKVIGVSPDYLNYMFRC
jgi:hypothetical protein